MLAKDVVVYAAGNLVVLLDLDTQQQTCMRSLGGGGVGALAVSFINPRSHLIFNCKNLIKRSIILANVVATSP